MKRDKIFITIYLLFIIFYSFIISIYFGYDGLMPLDDFQNFNSGFRVLTGDFPFRDYYSITGPVLDIMQSFFYLIFGVNWFSFVLHAGFFNAIYSVTIFFFLKNHNFSLNKILIYSLSGATLMLPASGNPTVEHHSLVLSAVSLLIFLVILKKNNRNFIYLLPIILTFSFFIKQVPTSYFALLILFSYLFYDYKKYNFKEIYLLSLSTLGSILCFLFYFKMHNVNFTEVYDQYISLALSLGKQRFEPVNFINIADKIKKIIFLFFCLFPLLFIKNIKKVHFLIYFGLFFICIFYELHSNQQEITFALLPIFISFVEINSNSGLDKNKYVSTFFYLIITYAFYRILRFEIFYICIYVLAVVAIIIIKFKYKKTFDFKHLLIIYLAISTAFYFERYIKSRSWDDLNSNRNQYFYGEEIDSKFKGIKWRSVYFNNPELEKQYIQEMLSILNKFKYNYLLITDYQIYSVLLKKKDFSPVKYWASGTSYPDKNHKLRSKFEIFFKNKLLNHNVKTIIIDNLSDFKSSRLKEFLWLSNCLEKVSYQNKNLNNIEIYNIKPKCILPN